MRTCKSSTTDATLLPVDGEPLVVGTGTELTDTRYGETMVVTGLEERTVTVDVDGVSYRTAEEDRLGVFYGADGEPEDVVADGTRIGFGELVDALAAGRLALTGVRDVA